MNIYHHPSDDILAAYAAGTTDEATALVIATHMALCPACRRAVAGLEAVGGVLMDETAAVPLAAQSWQAVEARISSAAAAPRQIERRGPSIKGPAIDSGGFDSRIPRPLRDYLDARVERLGWRRVGPGVRRVPLAVGPGATARLLEIAPGTELPRHGHSAAEFTLVLAGGYADEGGHYVRGDLEEASVDDVHRPRVDLGEPCLCLVVTAGPLRLTGLVGRLLQPLVRF